MWHKMDEVMDLGVGPGKVWVSFRQYVINNLTYLKSKRVFIKTEGNLGSPEFVRNAGCTPKLCSWHQKWDSSDDPDSLKYVVWKEKGSGPWC